MSRFEKIARAVSKIVNVRELEMLDDGCLSHVGDAIEAGAKEVLVDGSRQAIININSFYGRKFQTIPNTITVNGVELVPPVTEIKESETYWLCNPIEPDSPIFVWEDTDPFIHLKLERKFLFNTKDDAVLYTKLVLLAAHKKLMEDGEI